jgi:hypothetical protein
VGAWAVEVGVEKLVQRLATGMQRDEEVWWRCQEVHKGIMGVATVCSSVATGIALGSNRRVKGVHHALMGVTSKQGLWAPLFVVLHTHTPKIPPPPSNPSSHLCALPLWCHQVAHHQQHLQARSDSTQGRPRQQPTSTGTTAAAAGVGAAAAA